MTDLTKEQLDTLSGLIQKKSQYIPTFKEANKAEVKEPSFLEEVTGNDYEDGYSVPSKDAAGFFQQLRSDKQPGTHQAFNAVIGGTASGLATAVEDLSYIRNLFTQDWESNALADSMKDIKESINEELPINRTSNNVWDWDNGAMFWDSLKGTLDSAVGFAIPGMAVGSVVAKGVGTGLKSLRGIKFLETLAKSPVYADAITSLGTGFVMNDLEGTMMGLELYDNLTAQGIDKEEAAQKATEFKNLNRVFALTDALGVYGLFKGQGYTRDLMGPKGFLNELKSLSGDNLLLQGVKEGVEEIGQNVIQSEKEYEAYKDAGKDELANNISSEKQLFDRMLDIATSDKALYEGMLGFLGGGPQRVITELLTGQFGSKYKEQQNQKYTDQEAVIQETKDNLDKAVSDFKTTENLINTAQSIGADDIVETIKQSKFTDLLIKNFNAGTTENLERQLQEIIELDENTAQQRGLSPTYKQDAQNSLNELNKAEKQWIRLGNYVNRPEVFFNERKKEILKKQLANVKLETSEAGRVLNEDASRIAGREIKKVSKEANLPEGMNLGISFDIDNLDEHSYENPLQRKMYSKFITALKKTNSYKKYQEAVSKLEEVNKKLDETDEEYEKITSDEYQERGYAAKVNKVVREKEAEERENIKSTLEANIPNITNSKAHDEYKQQIDNSILDDSQKQELKNKVDKSYSDKLNKEKKDAPIANNINDLDLRYKGRPLLLEQELQQASEEEGIEFKTLQEYKDYLSSKKKDIQETPAAKNTVVKEKEVKVKTVTSTPEQPKQELTTNINIPAIINDMAMWEFKVIVYTPDSQIDKSNTKITILNLNNVHTTLSLGEFEKKYSLTESPDTWKKGIPYTLKDLNNNPIPSTLNDVNVDLDYLRDGKLNNGDTISYEVDRAYNRTTLPEQFRNVNSFKVLLVKYDNNERKIVGVLPAFKEGNNTDLLALRESIWKELQATKGQDNVFSFSKKTKVKDVWSGKFWNTGTKNNPTNVLTASQPYILGIAARGADKKVQLIAGFTDEENSRQLKTPNGENIFIVQDDNSAIQLTEGAVYQIIKGLDGKWYPYRTLTNSVKDVKGLKGQVLDLLTSIKTKEDYQRVKPILDDFYVKLEFTFTENPESDSKVFNFKPLDSDILTGLTAFELYEFADIDNLKAQVKAYRGTTPYLGATVSLPTGENVDYNDWIAHKGYIYTDLNPYQHFHSPKFTVEPFKVEVKETNAFEIKEPKLIIETFRDTLTGDNFHITEKQSNVSDIEAKKADIENRRKEELNNKYGNNLELISSKNNTVIQRQGLWGVEGKDYKSQNVPIEQIFKEYDEINAKYDAELAALESKKDVKTPDTSIPEDLGEAQTKIKKKTKFSLFKSQFTTWNQEQETEWFTRRFPNVPLYILDDLKKIHGQGHINAQGLFYNASVFIANNAGEGTTYHEAFHVVFNMYLNDKQQNTIIEEARTKYNLKDSSVEQIEEKLADEFMNYVLTEQEDKTWTAKIRNLFKRLWEFIKFNITNNTSIDELFYRTNQGSFKNAKFTRDVSKITPRFRATTLSPLEEYQAVRMVRELAIDILEDRKEAESLMDVKAIYSKAFDRGLKSNIILEVYRQLRGQVYLKDFSGNEVAVPELRNKPELLGKINQVLNGIYSNGELGPLYDEVVRSFRAVGIKINDKYDSFSEEGEIYEENSKEQNYSMSTAQVDPREKLSDRIRLWLNNIPNITEWNSIEDFDTSYNLFGFPETLSDNEAFNYLLENLSNSYSVNDMMSKLETLAANKLWINKVIADLNDDPNLRTDLFNIAQNINTSFLFLSQNKKGEFILSDSNSQGVVYKIISDFNAGFNSRSNSLINNDKIDIKEATEYYNVLTTIQKTLKADNTELEAIYNILNTTGLTLSYDVVQSIARDKKSYKQFIDNLVKLYGVIKDNKNPFGTPEIEEDEKPNAFNSVVLKNIANVIKKAYPHYYQATHINVENNKVYNHIRSSFLGRQIVLFTHPNEVVRKQELDKYLNTAFYSNSPLLRDLADPKQQVSKLFSFNIFDGLKRQNQDTGIQYDKMTEAQLNVTLLNSYFNNKKENAYYAYPVLSDTGNLVMINWKKYNKAQALEALYSTALQEWSRINETNKPVIKNYSSKSNEFILFPFLNSHKSLFDNVGPNKNKIKAIIEKHFEEKIVSDYLSKSEKWGIITNEKGKYITKDKQLDKRITNPEEFIRDFVYADTLMQIQLGITFSGDAAFYKSSEDFYKRNKQVWSPGTYLDTTQLDNTSFRVRVIKDVEGPSRFADSIEANLIKSGLNKDIATSIAKQYREGVNETDAQAYIDIYSYKQRMKGLARWTDREEAAYQRVIKGNAKPEDFVILQPIKPFIFTHIVENNTIVPLQLKDSELLLIPQFVEKADNKLIKLMTQMGYSFDANGKYKGFDEEGRKNAKYDDQILFESAVKVGLGEITDWSNIEKSKQYIVDYADYRVQQETPIHHQDDENLFGTQIRKLIMGDIDYTAKYTLRGKEISGKELLDEFNSVLSIEIIDLYKILSEDLSIDNYGKLVDKIKQEILDRGMPAQYLQAVEMLPNGETALPLWHPLISYKVETLLTSIVKNTGTKLKFNGGSFYNASGFGFDDSLDVKFNEDGSLNYFEVMMPAWSKDFIKYFTDKDGYLDVKKLEESGLDTGIVYRIPTENKYSMFRIKVKDFTPDIAGGAILMPSLVTKIAGLDYDIDKVYAMLYNHIIKDGKVIKVEPSLDSKEGRQNYILDIMTSVLTNKATLQQQLTPGGFETLKGLVDKWSKYVKGEGKTDFFSPITRSNVFTNNMTGNNLIGIFANANATHALFQHANMPLTLKSGIKFDNKQLSDLRTFNDTTNLRKVSENIAEFLAAAVDNAKDPIANYLNINTYTSDIIILILSVGYPIETAIAFVNQPVIRKFTELYLNEKGKISEINMFSSIKDEFKKQIKEQATGETPGLWNFNTEELSDNIKYIDKTEQRSDKFYRNQLKVLEAFEKYKDMSKYLSQLIRATKVADSGPGPTFADTVSKIRTVKRINTLSFQDVIVGGQEFLNEKTPTNELYNRMIKDATENFFKNDKITYLFNPAIEQILDEFEALKEQDLTAEEVEGIQRNIISFLATGFESYNSEQSKDVVVSTPQKLKEYKAKMRGKSKYEPFLAYLKTPKNETDTKSEIPFTIEFDGNTGANEYVQEVIMQTWEEMLINGDNEERELAKNLVRYTFYSAGFNFAPYSFYHLVPVNFFRNLQDSKGNTFDSYLKQKIEETKVNIQGGNDYLSNFREQYIRNYYPKLAYIKKAIFEDEKKANVSKIEYSEYKDNVPTDKSEPVKIFLNTEMIDKTDLLVNKEPVEYVKHSFKNKTYLFKLEKMNNEGAVYSRLEPLGFKIKGIGSLEFDINNPYLDSKWNFNKIKKTSNLSKEITKNDVSLQTKKNPFQVDDFDENIDNLPNIDPCK